MGVAATLSEVLLVQTVMVIEAVTGAGTPGGVMLTPTIWLGSQAPEELYDGSAVQTVVLASCCGASVSGDGSGAVSSTESGPT